MRLSSGGWDTEGGGEGAGVHALPGHDGSADDLFRGLAGPGIDDVGVVMSSDVEAAAVTAAGGDGSILDVQQGDGLAVFGIRERVSHAHVVANSAANHQVATDVHDDAVDSGGAQGRPTRRVR